MLSFLMRLSKGPVAVVPSGSRFQPVDTGEVAARMVELVLGGPAGRVRELGGPATESMADLMRAYLAAAGRTRPVVGIPVRGRLGAGLGVGGHMLADGGDRGSVSFADYLRTRLDAGTLENPYHPSRRRTT